MNIIDRLLKSTSFPLKEEEVIELCKKARQAFLKEPMLLELSVPLTVCGDIHGHFDELRRIFEIGGRPSHSRKYLFLGDYVDRGPKQLETICLLFAFKVNFPQTFHMLRGNHEEVNMCSHYGFLDECMSKFDKSTFDLFVSAFDCIPIAAIVEKKMFCVHGGISPELNSMDQIRNTQRPVTIPFEGLLCDLVWSDPQITVETWKKNEKRGVSWFFGPHEVMEFMKRFNLEVIVRAHQVVDDGFQFFAGLHFLTVFSCTNYGTNLAVFMHVDKNLHCTFHRI